MPTYTVITMLMHDGKKYLPGDAIELDAAVAKRLLGGVLIEGAPETPADVEPARPLVVTYPEGFNPEWTKKEICGWAKEKHNAELNPEDNKDTLLQAVAALVKA